MSIYVSNVDFCFWKNYFYTILDANTLKKEGKKKHKNIMHLKILKKSDKMNLTLFNTVESNIVSEKCAGKRWKRLKRLHAEYPP